MVALYITAASLSPPPQHPAHHEKTQGHLGAVRCAALQRLACMCVISVLYYTYRLVYFEIVTL